MRSLTFAMCGGLAALVLAGCSGASTTPLAPASAPESQVPPQTATSAESIESGALIQSAAAMYDIEIDLINETATAAPVALRSGQQSELYSLSIENFTSPDTLTLDNVSFDTDSVDLTYSVTHPFPSASDLSGDASAANREDLAVTGRVLFLIDTPDADTYFSGDDAVSVNTTLIDNADGYFMPGGLITAPGTSTNTFPYQTIVDETAGGTGNRVGIDNGGDVTGNFGIDGWDTSDFTSGISGYGIWGQGQTATNTLEIDRAELSGGASFSFRTVIVVKYEDPRGGANGAEKRVNRLPGNGRDFVYRMPHGALDVESVEYLGESGGLMNGVATSTDLDFRVVDWDARATESASTNLAAESDPTLVSAGESGVPTVEIDLPGIPGASGTLAVTDDDSGVGGDPEADSGAAGDALYYTGTLNATPTADGTFTGLVRAIDITDTVPPTDWNLNRFNLAPDLLPLGTNVEGTTYQAFSVDVGVVSGGGCTIPAPAKVASDITTWFSGRTTVTYAAMSGITQTGGFWDVATWPDPAMSGWVIENPSADELYHISSDPTPSGTALTAMTNTTRLGQVEVDSTGRVIYSYTTSTGTTSDGDLNDVYNAAGLSFSWFDYAGAPVAAPLGTMTNGGGIVAMALDQDDNVYTLDTNHILRKFDKLTGYTEDMTSPFPLDLKPTIGMTSVAGDDTDRACSDFVIDFHNGAFFFLVHGNGGAAFTYVYRVECDGSVQATVNGNPNPYVTDLSHTGHGVGTDITIDQIDTSGNVLTNQGDVQIIVSGNSATSGTPDGIDDLIVLNSDLQETAGEDIVGWSSDSLGKVAVSVDNKLIGKAGYFTGSSVHIYATPPTGWQ